MAHYHYNWPPRARATNAGEPTQWNFTIWRVRYLSLPLQGIDGFSHEHSISTLVFRPVQGIVDNL